MNKLLTSMTFAAITLAMASSPALAERTLRLSSQIPENHPIGENLSFFKEKVEEISDGEIQVQIYPSAQLYKGSEIPQAVASGSIDMGLVLIDEYSGTLPATGLFSVAFLFPDYEVLAKAAGPDSPVRQQLDEMIRGTGTKVLWWQDYGPIQLLANDEPLVEPEDMQDKKVRVLGKPSGDFIEALGGSPVKISGSEQFMAYQRGTVDVGMTGTTATKSRKLHEVMDYITITNHAQVEFLIVINDELWGELSDQEQAWMSEAALAAEKKMREETKAENLEAQQFLADETDMEVVELTEEQLEAWQQASEPAVQAYIEAAGETGRKLVDQVRQMQ
ncbi:C4-dicarboxylate-binding protein DctP [Modicisalibacter ilicicola DSM 19980]|uniref:C4-dicarboxylate-binding protein DctP n=1 Tax=Modicisalibacter ilicicola DSM 19980 TaxID=1121942 RepID=A0A1M5D4V5_9GAMM|nr:TRAP transporter substrate-binding protein DctP [Halomonas ilicicola]SHF61880.1 C4-dicarboxylate-binding protein DctP [Halomonas ilicicola DSM 19980]